jgi:hypothetical protein
MPSVFAHQVITDAGLALVASSSASNPIVWTMGISNATVPSDPEDKTQYTGLQAPVDAASATQNVARIVVGFANDTGSTVAVKAVALLGKLANQSASQAVIAAYVYDENSSIELSPSEMQRTRFAFNLVFNGVSTVSVFQTGDLTVADAERFVSCHAAGNPTLGEDQVIYGSKEWDGEQIFDNPCTFMDVVMSRSIFPATTVSYNLGTTTNRWATLYANAGNFLGSIATQNIYCRGKVGGRLFEIEERGTIGNSEIEGIYDDESDTYSLDIGGGDASGSRGMLFVKPCIVTTDASTGEKTEQMVPVYLGNLSNRFQGVYSLSVDTLELRASTQITSNRIDAEQIHLQNPSDHTYTAYLRWLDSSVAVSSDLIPTTAGTKKCGKMAYPWQEAYVKSKISFTNGLVNTYIASIYVDEEENGVIFDNSFASGSGAGTFCFTKSRGLARAKVIAAEYIGFNSTISSLVPMTSNPYRLDVGALVLAVASSFWIDQNRGLRFFPGDVLDLTDRSYPWYVGQQTVNTSTGNVMWDGFQERLEDTLPAGKYKLLNILRVYDAGSDHTMNAPVLLQRVE